MTNIFSRRETIFQCLMSNQYCSTTVFWACKVGINLIDWALTGFSDVVYIYIFVFCVAFFLNGDWFMQRGQTPMFAAKLFIARISTYKNATTWVLSMNFHQRHASPWLTGWPSTRIRSCCVLSAFIINKSKTMESKGY